MKTSNGLKQELGIQNKLGRKGSASARLAVRDLPRGKAGGFTPTPKFGVSSDLKSEWGFTLIEIVVATTIFAFVSVAITSMFNYTLKINRKAEALRQASQGMRNMVEFIVKEVRNGQVDYNSLSPCPIIYNSLGDTSLGVVNVEGQQECFYLDATTPTNLMYYKSNIGTREVMNPPNFTVDLLKFFVRPVKDPYVSGNPKTQPFVTIVAKFTIKLTTGEQVPIYYQTTVSTDKYDIPSN